MMPRRAAKVVVRVTGTGGPWVGVWVAGGAQGSQGSRETGARSSVHFPFTGGEKPWALDRRPHEGLVCPSLPRAIG